MKTFEHVKEVRPNEDYKVSVVFTGGQRGSFDCARYLNDPFWASLRDKSHFDKVFLDHGVLTWPDGVDIAPEEVWEDTVRI